jgi:hypothetical protein
MYLKRFSQRLLCFVKQKMERMGFLQIRTQLGPSNLLSLPTPDRSRVLSRRFLDEGRDGAEEKAEEKPC